MPDDSSENERLSRPTRPDTVAVHERLRAAREARGETLAEVAERLGMTAGGYGKIERGDRSIEVDMLFAVAEVLGESPAYLLTGVHHDPARATDDLRRRVDRIEAWISSFGRKADLR